MSEQLCVLPHDVERLAQDGHYLCPGHVKALPERIAHVTELHTQLARALTETTTSGERVKSSRDATGINLNEAVFAIRKDIETEYASWAGTVSTLTGHYLPAETLNVTTTFLIIHADWIARQEWVTELWAAIIYDPNAIERDQQRRDTTRAARDDLPNYTRPDYPEHEARVLNNYRLAKHADSRSLRSRARGLLQPSDNKRPTKLNDRCLHDNCDGMLIFLARHEDETQPSKVWCEKCGQEYGPESWLRMGKKIIARREQTQAS